VVPVPGRANPRRGRGRDGGEGDWRLSPEDSVPAAGRGSCGRARTLRPKSGPRAHLTIRSWFQVV